VRSDKVKKDQMSEYGLLKLDFSKSANIYANSSTDISACAIYSVALEICYARYANINIYTCTHRPQPVLKCECVQCQCAELKSLKHIMFNVIRRALTRGIRFRAFLIVFFKFS
jgi:hypothetical protein